MGFRDSVCRGCARHAHCVAGTVCVAPRNEVLTRRTRAQESATEWRKAYVSAAADTAYLQRYDNSSCTGYWSNNATLASSNQTASLVWSAAVGECTLVSSDENWYAAVVVYATKPIIKSATAFDYHANACGAPVGTNFRHRGAASCVQMATATGERNRIEPYCFGLLICSGAAQVPFGFVRDVTFARL